MVSQIRHATDWPDPVFRSLKPSLLAALAVLLSAALPAQARDQIRIVGSSTIFPFATAAAEEFGKTSGFRTPVVEATGSGGGLKLFCAGIGPDHPDIANASRRIKPSEVARCARNGIADPVEIKIGYDGIIVANAKAAPRIDFTFRDLWRALAAKVPGPDGRLVDNPHRTWADVNPALPAVPIKLYGPPPTSATREAFADIVLAGGCRSVAGIDRLKAEDPDAYHHTCHLLRQDGAFVEVGESDNLIVNKLRVDDRAFGLFGFTYLDQNIDVLHGSLIDGTAPTFEAIADGRYALSRALYIYVKPDHVRSIPGIVDFVAEITSDKAGGDFGYLTDKGFIPLELTERAQARAKAQSLATGRL